MASTILLMKTIRRFAGSGNRRLIHTVSPPPVSISTSSSRILIKGIAGYGYHGVLDHEAIEGQIFYVDLELAVDLHKASNSDSLEDTVDYGAISSLVVNEIESGTRVSLIEKLGGRIADNILLNFPKVDEVGITVHKPHAPVNVKVSDIAIQLSRHRMTS